MLSIQTRRFGTLDVDEAATLEFPQGLPGFETCRRFAVVEQPRLSPVVSLQSLDSPDLCFWAVPARAIDPNYSPDLSTDDLRTLGLETAGESDRALCLAILCAPENGPLTANLLAPIVVNLQNRLAVQAVRADSRYSHQHPIAAEALCW